MSFFENTRKPVGFGGKIMVAMMNVGHSAVARWGLQFLNAAPDAKVLDCGCGAVCVLYEGVQGVVYVFQIVDFVAHITLFGKTYRACFAYDRNFDLPGISELVLYAACYFG